MIFPIVIHKDSDSDYGVTVPDLLGCFSAGETLDETLAMAKEAIELHMEGLIAEGLPVPNPTTIERHKSNRDLAGGTWALVSIDDAKLRTNAKRLSVVNIRATGVITTESGAREKLSRRDGAKSKSAK